MAKGDPPHWLDRLGIDRSCRLAGMAAGMWVLTQAGDEWTLWLFDQAQMTGDRRTVRNAFADIIAGDWLERLYRC